MSLVATGSTVYGLGKAAGINLGGVTDFLGFGGKDPNYSSKSLVDTIANYEEVSTSEAQRIAPQMIEAAANGASDMQLAQLMAPFVPSGYISGVVSSKKWSLVKQQLQPKVNEFRSRQSRGQNTSGSAGSGTPSTAGFMKYGRWIVAGIVALIIGYLLNQG